MPQPRLTADGTDQPVVVPAGYALVVRPLGASVDVRDASSGTDYMTITSYERFVFGRSAGQTVYLRATSGTVIELALI